MGYGYGMGGFWGFGMAAFWILVIVGLVLLVRWYANETRRSLVACPRVAQETSMLRRLHVSGSA
jgi:uncharacterized membrane protein